MKFKQTLNQDFYAKIVLPSDPGTLIRVPVFIKKVQLFFMKSV